MMKNILLVRGKHLQMMVAYSIIKEDEATLHESVVKLFRSFNNDYSAFLLGILVHNLIIFLDKFALLSKRQRQAIFSFKLEL